MGNSQRCFVDYAHGDTLLLGKLLTDPILRLDPDDLAIQPFAFDWNRTITGCNRDKIAGGFVAVHGMDAHAKRGRLAQ